MQDLECEAIGKEEWDCLSFLEACGVALEDCPQSPQGTHVPFAVANWEHVSNCPLDDHPQPTTAIRKPTTTTPPVTMSETPTSLMGTK